MAAGVRRQGSPGLLRRLAQTLTICPMNELDALPAAQPGDEDLDALPRWGFAQPGRLRDELTALALAGTKTTTAGLLAEYVADGEEPAVAGAFSILVDSGEQPVALLQTVTCRVERLADVDDEHARDEGEGYANAAEFRAEHERFWNSYIDDLRTRMGDPTFTLSDDTPVVLERFRVVRRLG
jgi:uncharacterized protein YhfF